MKNNILRALSTVLFFAIVLTLLMASGRIAMPSIITQKQNLLHDTTPKNSVDIAFIGSSTTYRYYSVMDIWNSYGITSCTYFGADLPFEFSVPMMEYVQSTQSPQLYVLDLRSVLEDEFQIRYFGEHETPVHEDAFANALNLLNSPLSRASAVLESSYFEGEEYLQIFKLLYNHEAFSDRLYSPVTSPLFFQGGQLMMASIRDVSLLYEDFSQVQESEYTLTEETKTRLDEVFDYCTQNDLNVYFTFTPYADAVNVQDVNIRREIGEYVTQSGFAFTDFRSKFEQIGLEPATDFYDTRHVNVFGAKKYTQFAMEYFLAEYEIVPNHEEAVVAQWQDEYALWSDALSRAVAQIHENTET